MFIEKRLKSLYEFDKETPLYFDIEKPLEILQNYDEAELYKIIQFDKEFQNILETFLAVCFTARVLYENMEVIDFTKTTIDIIDYNLLVREFQLLDILKDIANYYEFIELKIGTIAYHTNLNMLIKKLKDLLINTEELEKIEKNEYVRYLLSSNINLMKSEISENKNNLKNEFREILKRNIFETSFKDFSFITTEYCLAVYKQDSLIDSLNYFANIQEILLSSGIDSLEKKSIMLNFIKLNKLYEENQKIQRKLTRNLRDEGFKK